METGVLGVDDMPITWGTRRRGKDGGDARPTLVRLAFQVEHFFGRCNRSKRKCRRNGVLG